MASDRLHRLVNGEKVYLTDSEIESLKAEQLAYNNDLTNYKQNIDIQVQILIDKKCQELRYDNIYQVTQFATVEGEYQLEAVKLLEWNARVWELTETHIANVTEIPNFDFIATLPEYETGSN